MATENKAAEKKVKKPVSLKSHRLARAKLIHLYLFDCINHEEKIDKAFLKELGDIA